MLQAPNAFRGSWTELYRDHMQAVLPEVGDVCQFHDWMGRYCDEPAPVFPVRSVAGTQRRRVYSTADRTQIAPADNSPAWIVHAVLIERRLSSYRDFRDLISTMPTHMFDIRRCASRTANDFGWYVAHIVPAKNGDTNFQLWDRREDVASTLLFTTSICFSSQGTATENWENIPVWSASSPPSTQRAMARFG